MTLRQRAARARRGQRAGWWPTYRKQVFSFAGIATAVLDGHGTVLRWSQAACDLLGWTAEDACGRPFRALFAEARPGADDQVLPARGRARLRHRAGRPVDVTFRVLDLHPADQSVVLVAPTRPADDWEQGASTLRALLAQENLGIALHDPDLTLVRSNLTPGPQSGAALPPGSRLRDVLSPQDVEAGEAALRRVLRTGAPLTGRSLSLRSAHGGPPRRVSLWAFRVEDAAGVPEGVLALYVDTLTQQRAGRELDLLQRAAVRIGGSLDPRRAAQDLADVLVPALGDLSAVSLAEAVLHGDEPPRIRGGGDLHLRRAAVASAAGPYPDVLLQPGQALPSLLATAELRELQHGRAAVFDPATVATLFDDPAQLRHFVPDGGHSALWAPLFARGLVLGTVAVWRTEQPDAFDEQDVDMLTEIASRSALNVDNARRYLRERRSVLALQQRLLPRPTTDSPAVETAGLYRPAGGGSGISGDWYDVIPLPSFRVALAVGDVSGHGLYATATMGRLRTAVRTLADLELDPTELLTHLDDGVRQLAGESDAQSHVDSTCLYAVYDPITCLCQLASAGHPSPVVVRPDGTVKVVDVSPGPPLGVGGMPFETATVDLEPGSVLALYSKGLIERDAADVEGGLRWLTESLAASCGSDRSLADVGRALLAGLGDGRQYDDIALLLARTRALPEESTASWEFTATPAVVSAAREAVARQLTDWGLDELVFTTELIVSELVTNAVRHAGGPIGLRLIRGDVLVCEVTDPSSTQPRLRRARWTDEGGRGLFLVAQLSLRWGSRYGRAGKTIWSEQALAPPAVDFEALM